MAKEVPLVLLFLDSVFRRFVIPLCLVAAVLFRYNVISSLYLVLLLISFILPSTRNSAHAGFYLAFSSLTTLLSLAAVVGQCLFQVILTTDYRDQFAPCNSTESNWRQVGLILFSGANPSFPSPPATDVVRYLVIDVGVFLVALLSLIISAVTVHFLRQQPKRPEERVGEYAAPNVEAEGKEETSTNRGAVVRLHTTSSTNSSASAQQPHSQPFIHVPDSILFSIEILYLLLLSLCASVVPSITAFIYLAALLVFLFLLSIHVSASTFKFGMRIIVMVYTALHLVFLYVFQFSGVQMGVEVDVDSTGYVTVPLSLRLAGMTPVIYTNCSEPSGLFLYQGTIYSYFLNPGFLLLLFYMASLDFRLRIFKPRVSWDTRGAVYFPSFSPYFWVSYSAPPSTRSTPTVEAARLSPHHGIPDETADGPNAPSTKGSWLNRSIQLVEQIVFAVSFGVALVAMMAWSIVFPSWLTLVLLLWACVIWIFPCIYPNTAILFTSPLLVVYSSALLVLHYVTFLKLTPLEVNQTSLIYLQINQIVPTANREEEVLHFPYVLMQCLFTAAFFLAMYTMIRNVKELRRERMEERRASSEMSPRPSLVRQDTLTTMQVFVQLKDSVVYYISFYWGVVTMAAFLLAALVGPPSLFKIIYMFGFLLSILIYQIFSQHWYMICRPVWWGYILYSFVELTVIYIYQFRPVAGGILDSLNNITGSVDVATDWLSSIGFTPVDVNESYTVAQLLVILLPSTVFIAVLAMQLRYFYPKLSSREETDNSFKSVEGAAKTFLHTATQSLAPGREDVEASGDAEDEHGASTSVNSEEIGETPASDQGDGTADSSQQEEEQKGKLAKLKTWIVDISRFVWHLFRNLVIFLNQIFWKFLEIHLHKIVALVIFSIIIDKPGAGMVILLALTLLSMPLRQLNFIFYPVYTFLVGAAVICEMIYQFRIIDDTSIDLSSNRCSVWGGSDREMYTNSLVGSVMTYVFSTKLNDAAWFGLYKTSNFAAFSAGHIAAILLLALWFSTKRRMKRHNEKLNMRVGLVVLPGDKGSLFPGVTRAQAETNIWMGLKYLINHFFDFYGVQVCCALVAIVMTSRDDAYSAVYGFLLGACLLLAVAPDSVVRVAWPILTYLVGVFLVVQYSLLLGAPNGACLRPNSNLSYPWVVDSFPEQWRRYLFLSDYVDILDKYYLYADFILFLVMALKTFRIFKVAQHTLNLDFEEEGTDGEDVKIWNTRKFLNKCREYLFGNWFWVSIFLLFLAGALRVSLFGYVHLILCFVMGWKGREMLAADTKKLRISWEIVRIIVWLVMLARALLQILGCVYFHPVSEAKCIAVLLLDADCSSPGYYNRNSSLTECAQFGIETRTLGLGVDAALFVALTIQIIMIKTRAFSRIQEKYRKTLIKGQGGAAIFDRLVKERLVNNIENEKSQLEAINARLSLLRLQQGKLVAHKMHAGVIIPKDVKVLKNSRRSSTATSGTGTPHLDRPPTHEWSTIAEPSQPSDTSKDSDTGGILYIIKAYVTGFYSLILTWLEDQSYMYRKVQSELGRMATPRDTPQRSVSPATRSTTVHSPVEEPSPRDDDSKPRVEVHKDPSGGGSGRGSDIHGDGTRGDGSHGDGGGYVDDDVDASGNGGDDHPHKVSFDDKEDTLESSISDEVAAVGVSRKLIRTPALVSAYDSDTEHDTSRRKTFERSNSVSVILDKAETLGSQVARLFQAIFFFLLANTAHICYFFLILSVINNGSVLSLVYAILLFFWGLLAVPSPTKRFWLALIVYTMFNLLVTYGFQFREIMDVKDLVRGLPVLEVIGISFSINFLAKAIWDILLLFSLVIHRAILKESGLWRSTSLQIAVISDIHKEVNAESRSRGSLIERSESNDSNSDNRSIKERSVFEDYVVVVRDDTPEFDDLETAAFEGGVSVWQKLKSVLRRIFGGAFKFYKKAVNPNITFGARDFYVVLFCLDAICFFIIVIGFSFFGLGQGDVIQVASFIQQNNVPFPFLIVLLLQFMSMVIDRFIYLKKSIAGKFVFNILLIIAWHSYLFFILPAYTGRPFLENPYAQAIYFFKAWYLIISSLQVISGYPFRVLGYFWGKKTDIISGTVLIVYRLIPIIPFLRVVMDWTASSTSLRLKQYITIEEIWAQLFQKSVFRKWERDSPRDLGAPPSTLIKVLMGGGLILLSIALLWGPLIVISLIQQGSQPNPPVSFRASLTISGFPALFTMDAQGQFIKPLDEQQFMHLQDQYAIGSHADVFNQFLQRRYQISQFTRIVLQGDGNLLWTISPPAREQLVTSLNETSAQMLLEFSWRVGRQPASGLIAATVEGKTTRNLNSSNSVDMTIRANLVNILNSSSNDNVSLPELFPRILNAPPSGVSKGDSFLNVLAPTKVTCVLSHNGNLTTGEWWSLSQSTEHLFADNSRPQALEFIVFSDLVSLPLFDAIVGQGIIGLYAAVVLVAANFLRGWMNDLFFRLTFEETPNPDYLLDLCESLFIARENGELVLEEILAGHLVYIFRSNAKFLEWTKPKQD